MTRLPFDQALDRCIEEVRRGRMTVEECLDRYPEHRARLEPLLRAAAAMSALPRGTQASAPSAQQRAAFMAALRQTPQQSRRRLPSLRLLLGAGTLRVAGPAFALAVLGVVLVLGGGGTPASAASVTVFGGEVQRLDGAAWKPVRDGELVEAGMRMRTGATGRAVLTFSDGSTVALDPRTEIAIDTLAAAPRRVDLRQQSGRLWNDVVHDEMPGARFTVLTPDARVEVTGTVFATTVDADTGRTEVATVEGEVRVIAGDRAVPVGRGEALHTRNEVIESVSAAPLLDNALTISGPFAVAIMAPDGRGTGVRADGVTFHQLRGISTSRHDETQRFDLFDLQDVERGEFLLVLQRYADGDGEIVLDTPGKQQRFTVDAGARAASLTLRLEIVDGLPVLSAAMLQRADEAPSAPTARIAPSDLTRSAVDLASRGKDKDRRASATRTPTPKAAERPEGPEEGRRAATARPTEEADERTATATRTPSSSNRGPSAAATVTATPPGLDVATLAYAQRLRVAVASGRSDLIRAALAEALAADVGAARRGRVAAIAAALENETNALRIGALFVAGQDAVLREDLRAALDGEDDDARERFEEGIKKAEGRRLTQSSEARPPGSGPLDLIPTLPLITPTR